MGAPFNQFTNHVCMDVIFRDIVNISLQEQSTHKNRSCTIQLRILKLVDPVLM